MNFLVICILFIALITASSIWCVSAIKRIADTKIKNCFVLISLGVSLLSLINLLKCSVTQDTVLQTVLTVLYCVPTALILVCAIISAVIIGKKCRGTNPPVLPVVIIALMLIYSVLYALNVPIISSSPINIINGALILLLCESCICPRLVKTGADYSVMFENSNLAAVITDSNMDIIYRTKAPTPDSAIIKSAIENGIEYKPNEDVIVTASAVDGGFAVFTREIKELNMLLDELNETSQQLQKSNELIAREGEIRSELTGAKILNKLYDENVSISAQKLGCVSGILRSLPDNDKTVRSNMLIRAKLLTCYVKNKFEMLSCIEQSGTVHPYKLFDSVCETVKILEGIIKGCSVEITPFKAIDSRITMLIYDWLESLCEFSLLFGNSSLKAELLEHQGEVLFGITLDGLDAHKKFEVDKELVRKTSRYNGKAGIEISSYSVAVKIKLPTEVL